MRLELIVIGVILAFLISPALFRRRRKPAPLVEPIPIHTKRTAGEIAKSRERAIKQVARDAEVTDLSGYLNTTRKPKPPGS